MIFDNIEDYKQHFDELQETFLKIATTLKTAMFKYVGR